MMWLEYYKQFRTAEVGGKWKQMTERMQRVWGKRLVKWYPYSCCDEDGSDIFSGYRTCEGKQDLGEQDVEFILTCWDEYLTANRIKLELVYRWELSRNSKFADELHHTILDYRLVFFPKFLLKYVLTNSSSVRRPIL